MLRAVQVWTISDARCASAPLLPVRVRLPSELLGTALHNLSRDSGDLFTTLSILLYLLNYPTPRSDYYCMYASWPLAYFHSSSGSSINSSTIVSSTQTKNLVVFQFRLRANPFQSSLRLHRQLPGSRSSDSAVQLSPDRFCIGNLRNPSVTSGPYRKSWHKGIGSASPNSVRDSVVLCTGHNSIFRLIFCAHV